jgi:protein ImuB
MTMSWACILLPQLALDGVLRRHPQPERPLALVTGPAQKRVLAAVNPAAERLGLHAGQALAAAHALSSGFATLEYDPDDVARSRDFLAAWAYRYSSQVGAVAFNGMAEDAIVLEIGASLRLFGPWPRFERQLREDLTALASRIALWLHRIRAPPGCWRERMTALH